MNYLEVRISFRQFAKGRVHLEAGLQMHLGIAHITQQRIVTTHVVIIDRLLQERGRTGQKELFGLGSFAELVQTKAGVEEAGAILRGNATKFPADGQGARPAFSTHQMMQSELQDFGPVLGSHIDGVELLDRFPGHAQFGVPAGGSEMTFEIHASLLSKKLAHGWMGKINLS
jgi:hypothetical protein